MAHLIIVRHAESHYNLQNRIQGHLDSKLTPRGLSQARRLAKRMKSFKIDKVYSSDLGRAYTTTKEITKYIKTTIIRDPKLREIQLGAWEGMTPAEVDRLYDKGYQKWLKKPSSITIPKGEKLSDFKKRITTQVQKIAEANPGKTVLIVTHGGAITALLANWMKADFDTLLVHLQIDNTSLTIVDSTKIRTKIRAINDASHLPDKDKHAHTIFSR
jgi:probable phosphoglycerate mutase